MEFLTRITHLEPVTSSELPKNSRLVTSDVCLLIVCRRRGASDMISARRYYFSQKKFDFSHATSDAIPPQIFDKLFPSLCAGDVIR